MLPPASAPLRPEQGGSLALRGQQLGGLVERCDGAADSDDTWSSSSADSGGEVSEAGPMQALATTPMSFGDIAVENSSEVYIGTTHIHMAPGSHVTVAYPNGRHAALATADHDRHLPAIVLPPVVQDLHLPALPPAPGDDLHVPGVPPSGVQDLHLPDEQQQQDGSMRELQADAIDAKGFEDIAYNFLVGGDQEVYEARGWSAEPRHGRDQSSLAGTPAVSVAMAKQFEDDTFDWDQFFPWYELASVEELVALGKRLGALRQNVSFRMGSFDKLT